MKSRSFSKDHASGAKPLGKLTTSGNEAGVKQTPSRHAHCRSVGSAVASAYCAALCRVAQANAQNSRKTRHPVRSALVSALQPRVCGGKT